MLSLIKHHIAIEQACISLLEKGKRINGNLSIAALSEIAQHEYALEILQKLMAGASTGDTEGRSEQPCSATEGRTATDPAANFNRIMGDASTREDEGACPSAGSVGKPSPAKPFTSIDGGLIHRWDGVGPQPHRYVDDYGRIVYRSYEDYCFDGEPE